MSFSEDMVSLTDICIITGLETGINTGKFTSFYLMDKKKLAKLKIGMLK